MSIPRIPLNLVLLKGIHILGYQVPGLRHAPAGRHMARNDRELLGLLAQGRARSAHRRPSSTWRTWSTALRHVADGRAVGKVLLRVTPPGLRPGGTRGAAPPGTGAIVDVDVGVRFPPAPVEALVRACRRAEGGFR